jgi:receptor protein-tyrosine kinase
MHKEDENDPPAGGQDHRSLIERAAERSTSLDGEGRDVASARKRISEGAPSAEPLPTDPSIGHDASDSDRAQIDLKSLSDSVILRPGIRRSRLLEEFRIIKRAVLKNVIRKRQNGSGSGILVMVSSTRPGEGKTTVAINLALSLALERDFTVLLVDGDLTKPTIMTKFGIEASKGLVDILDDPTIDLEDVIIQTTQDRLTLLPSGRPHALGAELLASERMKQILANMAESDPQRVVVFDSPPILASSEPSALATNMDHIIFVIEADKTAASAVRQALQLLDANEKIGLVLNRTRAQLGATQFGSYYKAYAGQARALGS